MRIVRATLQRNIFDLFDFALLFLCSMLKGKKEEEIK